MITSIRAFGALSLFALAAAVAQPARAESAADILSHSNLVTTGNATTTSDIEGNAVVGGNLNGATFFNSHAPASPVVSVYGALTNMNGMNLNAGGSLFYNGVISTPSHHVNGAPQVNFNGGGSQKTLDTVANPIGDYTNPLTALSTQLGNESATSGASEGYNSSTRTFTFNAGANTGIVVFDISESSFMAGLQNASNGIKFTGGADVTYIVNVTGGGAFTVPGGVNWNGPAQQDALFNFEDATSVNVGRWEASLLAPDAVVTNTNAIEGSVFAASFRGNGELHNYLFDGQLPSIPVATPEPSTWAMMFMGLAGIAFLGWRRAHKGAAATA